MTVGSLFSGIGGLDLGLERAGMTIAWQCEIDRDCRAVLRTHWPDVTCYPDVEALDGPPAVDVLCGGFPCQDISVAGRRAGLAGDRSRLFHEFMRVAAELAPRWVLVENVPGLLSSNDGRDMGTVLGCLADLGYGWCYRVLDAQYFGVAQRRRRVFIVGCAGGASDRAAQVLLEPESCAGDPPPSRTAGEGIAGTLGGGSGQRGFCDDLDRSGAFIPEPTAFMWMAAGNNDASGALEVGFTPTLPSSQTVAVAYSVAVRGRENGQEWELGDPDVGNALRAGDGGSSRGNWVMSFMENQRGETWEAPIPQALNSGGGKPGQGYPAVRDGMAVRRLLPVECERLQGFPDDWTAGRTDSARYRMLGNAVCVPVAEWIGRQIVARQQEDRDGQSQEPLADGPHTVADTPSGPDSA